MQRDKTAPAPKSLWYLLLLEAGWKKKAVLLAESRSMKIFWDTGIQISFHERPGQRSREGEGDLFPAWEQCMAGELQAFMDPPFSREIAISEFLPPF